MSIPYMAVGNDELGEYAETIKCDKCGKEHEIEYGTSSHLLPDGTMSKPEPSKTIGFYKCGDQSYLGTINGRLINR